jgi:hypothetical protein
VTIALDLHTGVKGYPEIVGIEESLAGRIEDLQRLRAELLPQADKGRTLEQADCSAEAVRHIIAGSASTDGGPGG